MSEAASEAAAALVAGIDQEFADRFQIDAEETPEPLAAMQSDVAQLQAASQPQPVQAAPEAPAAPVAAEEVAPEPFVVPTFDAVLDDEYRELLEEPDFEAEAAAEVGQRLDDGEVDEYQDPETAKRLTALEKRNAWLEGQVVRASKPKWVAEAKRNYPDLARYAAGEIEALDASSRRQFARQAHALNERFAKIAKPLLDDLAARRGELRQETVTEARQEVAAAWGTPTVGPPVVAVAQSAQDAELAAARKTGQLHRVFEVMMRQGQKGGSA